MKKPAFSQKTKTRARQKSKRRLPPGVPNPVDIHVGSRVRLRRTLLGLSQEKLGDAVGLTNIYVNRMFRDLRLAGLLEIIPAVPPNRGGTLRILDPDRRHGHFARACTRQRKPPAARQKHRMPFPN